jgi:hypothetical protein
VVEACWQDLVRFADRREPMGLTDAAIAAVSQWEFEPARFGSGPPVEVVMTPTVRFSLS